MDETTFTSSNGRENTTENDDALDAITREIEFGKPSFLRRSTRRMKSLRHRRPDITASGDYGTFDNPAFHADDSVSSRSEDEVDHEFEVSDEQGPDEHVYKKGHQKRDYLKWKKFKMKVNDTLSIFNVSRRIECFGGGVFSYFSFVSWLGKINLFTSILYLSALIFPYAFIKPSIFNETITSINTTRYQKIALQCSRQYEAQLEEYIKNRTSVKQLIDGLQGTGFMERWPIIFIGSYFDKIFWQSKSSREVRYDASFAFYFCLWMTLGFSLIVTIIASGRRILKRMSTKDEKLQFTFKVLSRWDFIIQDQKRAKVEKQNILTDLKTSIDEEKRLKAQATMSTKEKRKLWITRIAIWCSYIILLGGCLTAIYFANDASLKRSKTFTAQGTGKSSTEADVLQLLFQYLPSLVIVGANFIVATYCGKIVTYEKYTANTEILITIWRTVILRFASLVVLMASILNLLRRCYNPRISIVGCSSTLDGCEKAPCWETYIGQQFYKLVVLDFVVFVLVILFDLFKKLVGKKIKLIPSPQFDIANNVLDLIYSQTLCWLGMFFCPLLTVVTFIKIIIIYLIRKVLVIHHVYQHDAKSANAAQTDSYFLDILLIALIFVIILPLAVATSLFSPSSGCSPYRIQGTNQSSIQSRAVINLPQHAQNVYEIIDSLIVMVPLWIVLSVIVYYYYTLSRSREKLKNKLEARLVERLKDLAFARKRLNNALREMGLARQRK